MRQSSDSISRKHFWRCGRSPRRAIEIGLRRATPPSWPAAQLRRPRAPQGRMSASVQGFGCRPSTAVQRPPAAGVRKPPRNEPAGDSAGKLPRTPLPPAGGSLRRDEAARHFRQVLGRREGSEALELQGLAGLRAGPGIHRPAVLRCLGPRDIRYESTARGIQRFACSPLPASGERVSAKGSVGAVSWRQVHDATPDRGVGSGRNDSPYLSNCPRR
jgi:hypothetical protein